VARGGLTPSLLDTSVLIAPGADTLGELPVSAAISVVSLGELHAGVQLARDDVVRAGRQARLAAIRAAFLPLAVDEAVAQWYGTILAIARKERRATKATDLLIIATAAATGRTLTTRDVAQAALARQTQVPVTTT
jgi:predicted nucleic acid-binding protein